MPGTSDDSATYVGSCDTDVPADNTLRYDGAAEIRQVKIQNKTSFPNVTGAVTKTHTQLNNAADKGSASEQVFVGNVTIDKATPAVRLEANNGTDSSITWVENDLPKFIIYDVSSSGYTTVTKKQSDGSTDASVIVFAEDGSINVTTGTLQISSADVATEAYVDAAVGNVFASGQDTNAISSTAFNLQTSVTASTWTAVNSTNWTALSSVASGSDWIEVRLVVDFSNTGSAADKSFQVFARGGDSSAATSYANRVAAHTYENVGNAETRDGNWTFKIAINSTPEFDVYWTGISGTSISAFNFYLVGYGANG